MCAQRLKKNSRTDRKQLKPPAGQIASVRAVFYFEILRQIYSNPSVYIMEEGIKGGLTAAVQLLYNLTDRYIRGVVCKLKSC